MARILVIDDDAQLRAVIRRILEPSGHEVALAGNGLEGAQMCRERGADLVLLDIHMPVANGMETLILLADIAPSLRIIVISGGSQSFDLDLLGSARLLGARSTLPKPFTRQELLDAVGRALAEPGAA
jgi:CheY-like chemotaxis protein